MSASRGIGDSVLGFSCVEFFRVNLLEEQRDSWLADSLNLFTFLEACLNIATTARQYYHDNRLIHCSDATEFKADQIVLNFMRIEISMFAAACVSEPRDVVSDFSFSGKSSICVGVGPLPVTSCWYTHTRTDKCKISRTTYAFDW